MMGRRGGCNFEELAIFQQNLEKLTDNMPAIMDVCAKNLAQRLIRKTKFWTPVGVYSNGKQGGTLKKGWSTRNVRIYHTASCVMVEIINPVEYASYVEYGHRTVNHTGWVPGRFMMTFAEGEIQRDAPGILERKIKKMMEAALK